MSSQSPNAAIVSWQPGHCSTCCASESSNSGRKRPCIRSASSWRLGHFGSGMGNLREFATGRTLSLLRYCQSLTALWQFGRKCCTASYLWICTSKAGALTLKARPIPGEAGRGRGIWPCRQRPMSCRVAGLRQQASALQRPRAKMPATCGSVNSLRTRLSARCGKRLSGASMSAAETESNDSAIC